jgi:hypothetical protein
MYNPALVHPATLPIQQNIVKSNYKNNIIICIILLIIYLLYKCKVFEKIMA